jgi:hypothetical protein
LATIAIARSTRTALPIGAERGHRGAVTPADVEHQQVPAGTAAGRALLLGFDGHLVAYCERRASRGKGDCLPTVPHGTASHLVTRGQKHVRETIDGTLIQE